MSFEAWFLSYGPLKGAITQKPCLSSDKGLKVSLWPLMQDVACLNCDYPRHHTNHLDDILHPLCKSWISLNCVAKQQSLVVTRDESVQDINQGTMHPCTHTVKRTCNNRKGLDFCVLRVDSILYRILKFSELSFPAIYPIYFFILCSRFKHIMYIVHYIQCCNKVF